MFSYSRITLVPEVKRAVQNYLLMPCPLTLRQLIHTIRQDRKGFFIARGADGKTLFEKIIFLTHLTRCAQIKRALGFISQLYQAALNPLIFAYDNDKRTLDLCISILKEAIQEKILKVNEYLLFYQSAIDNLFNVPDVPHAHILYLVIHLHLRNSTPLSTIVKYFNPLSLPRIFASFNLSNCMTREYKRGLLIAKNSQGVTPLHCAIRHSDSTGFCLLLSSMSALMTTDEHLRFHLQGMPNHTFLDWIQFYGDLQKYEIYRAFLRKNLSSEKTEMVLKAQASALHPMREQFDNQSALSQEYMSLVTGISGKKIPHGIFNFKLFSFPEYSCDGKKADYGNDRMLFAITR